MPAGSRARKEWEAKETGSADQGGRKLSPGRDRMAAELAEDPGKLVVLFWRWGRSREGSGRGGRGLREEPGSGQGQGVCGDMGMAGGSHLCAGSCPEAQVVSWGKTQGGRRPQVTGTGELIPATASCDSFLRAPQRRPPCPSCPRSTALWSAYPPTGEAGFPWGKRRQGSLAQWFSKFMIHVWGACCKFSSDAVGVHGGQGPAFPMHVPWDPT